MALEIERKFLIASPDWRGLVTQTRRLRQAYLANNDRVSVRVRIDGREAARLTVKTANASVERHEFEYPIPVDDAEDLLLQREGVLIIKTRHIVPIGPLVWEIDTFENENAGLSIAEIELERPDQVLERPVWLGEEITHDRRYYNAQLAKNPFSRW